MSEYFTDADRDALQRCINLTLAENDKGRVEQVEEMLGERDWWEVATFCAYHRQMIALELRPWEIPPCNIAPSKIAAILKDSRNRDYDAAKLAQRLIAKNKSLYEPDPVAVLPGRNVI